MRFLVDNSLPKRMAAGLCHAGHDAVHVRDLGMSTADDEAIFAVATVQDRIIVAQDTDFATILAMRGSSQPSVVLFRRRLKSVEALLPLLLANLARIAPDLEAGSVAVLEDTRIRVRQLPIGRQP
jgi:predicted nuclease of predicted toxin-antitoxin system